MFPESFLKSKMMCCRYDALVESPERLEEESREDHRIWLLWLLSLSMMLFSGIATGYWESAKLRFETKVKGPVAAMFAAFENWFDPSHVLEQGKKAMLGGDEDEDDEEAEASEDKVAAEREESFMYEYLTQLVDVLLLSLSFSSGWLVSAAVKAMLIKTYSGVYDPDEVTDVSGDVIWSVWLAFVIALLASVLVMTYLSKLVQKLRQQKHELLESWKQELEQGDKDKDKDKEVEIVAGGGRAQNVTDDPQEVQEEDGDGKQRTDNQIEMQ